VNLVTTFFSLSLSFFIDLNFASYSGSLFSVMLLISFSSNVKQGSRVLFDIELNWFWMYYVLVSSTSFGNTTFCWFYFKHSISYLRGFIWGLLSFKIYSTFSCVKALFIVSMYSAIKTTAKSGSSATMHNDWLFDFKSGST